MKFIFILFVCCLAVALANAADDADRKRALKICREEMNVTDKDLEDPKKLGCFYRCVHLKEGYIFADGGININKATQGSLDPILWKKVQADFNKNLEVCAETSMGDTCRASLCLERTRTT